MRFLLKKSFLLLLLMGGAAVLLFHFMDPRILSRTSIANSPEMLAQRGRQARARGEPVRPRDAFWMWDEYDTPSFGPDTPLKQDKYLIYRCQTGNCGGWNNRVSGALFAYIMANVTGRQFVFEHLLPDCDITRYVVPNKVNWHHKQLFHDVVTPSHEVKHIKVIDNKAFFSDLLFRNYSHIIGGTKYVYFKGNLFYELVVPCSNHHSEVLKWTERLHNGEIRAALFKRLFRLSDNLRQTIAHIHESNLPTPKQRLLCAHIRMGINPDNPFDFVTRLNKKDLLKLWSFFHNLTEHTDDKVFIASDSEYVLNQAHKQSFGHRIISLGGPILHVDRTRPVAEDVKCVGLERLILEEHLLMTCDVLLVSHSGIGHTAAHVRGTDTDLFCLYKGAKLVPCKREELMVRYFDDVYSTWNHGNCSDVRAKVTRQREEKKKKMMEQKNQEQLKKINLSSKTP